jgi:hypothetical protein
MQKKFGFTIAALAAVATVGMTGASQAAPTASTPAVQNAGKVSIPVVAGATALSATEKGGVVGLGDTCTPPPCPPPPCTPVDAKPGYGFGTTGHYGPPGQGFTPRNSWRRVVASGGTTTPKGNNLPPTAFK